MIRIASLSKGEREELFLNTAQKIGMPPAIVEKDFWVCYMLDYLFHRCEGTSLSKAYHQKRRRSRYWMNPLFRCCKRKSLLK